MIEYRIVYWLNVIRATGETFLKLINCNRKDDIDRVGKMVRVNPFVESVVFLHCFEDISKSH